MKILRLANTPGMDEVAIKLNCEPTYFEVKEAKKWQRALELADLEGVSAMDHARALHKEFKV